MIKFVLDCAAIVIVSLVAMLVCGIVIAAWKYLVAFLALIAIIGLISWAFRRALPE